MLLVIEVITGVLITIGVLFIFLPFTFSMFHALHEFTYVYCTRFPLILTIAIGFSILILTSIDVLVGKIVCTLSIFYTMCPFTFVFITIKPLMDTITPYLIVSPFTHIAIIFLTFPYTETIFRSLYPFTIINFSTCPCINTFPMRFIVQESTSIYVSIFIKHISLTISFIIKPFTLIYLPIVIDQYALSFTFSCLFAYQTFICSMFINFYSKIFMVFEGYVCENIRKHLIIRCYGNSVRVYFLQCRFPFLFIGAGFGISSWLS